MVSFRSEINLQAFMLFFYSIQAASLSFSSIEICLLQTLSYSLIGSMVSKLQRRQNTSSYPFDITIASTLPFSCIHLYQLPFTSITIHFSAQDSIITLQLTIFYDHDFHCIEAGMVWSVVSTLWISLEALLSATYSSLKCSKQAREEKKRKSLAF